MSLEKYDERVEKLYQSLEEDCNKRLTLVRMYFKAFLYDAGHDILKGIRENITGFKDFAENNQITDYDLKINQLEEEVETLEQEFGGKKRWKALQQN